MSPTPLTKKVPTGPAQSYIHLQQAKLSLSVQGEFTVPSPTVPSGSGPGWYYTSIFVGIDGWNDDVVVQAGVFIETEYTSSGERASYYYAWYEWYPESQIEISNLPVSTGNVI
jgi:hypothetical protein